MPKRCPDCYGRTSTPGRCPQCRAEHLATTAGHADDDARTCAWCSRSSTEGRYVETGMWLCDSCVRERIAAESVPVGTDLDRAIRWAVGDDAAYPESDPGECAFVSGSDSRLIADGGGSLLDPSRLGRCPACQNTVHRDDERFEVTRSGEEHPPMGTSVYYHTDCAPFGATSIPDEIEKQQESRRRGAEMRADLLDGGDA